MFVRRISKEELIFLLSIFKAHLSHHYDGDSEEMELWKLERSYFRLLFAPNKNRLILIREMAIGEFYICLLYKYMFNCIEVCKLFLEKNWHQRRFLFLSITAICEFKEKILQINKNFKIVYIRKYYITTP